MKRLFTALVIALGLIALIDPVVKLEAVPPRAGQPHTDTFTGSYGNLQDYNPVTQKAKTARAVTYTLTARAGCSMGSIASDTEAVAADWNVNLGGFQLVRVSANADIDIIVSCGNEQVNRCGGTNIFCVQGRPFYGEFTKPTLFISDVLNTYPAASRRSILAHELFHAIATWNEQYCVGYETVPPCAGQPQFTSTPGWEDIMNTGPLSRHDLGAIEIERWDRTMYAIIQQCANLGYDPCSRRWFQADGWSWSPENGYWYGPTGRAEFAPCNADRIRWNELGAFFTPLSAFFVPARGYWATAPPC